MLMNGGGGIPTAGSFGANGASPVGAVAAPSTNSFHHPNNAAKYMQLNVTLDRAEITGFGGFIRPDPYVEISVDGKPPKKTDTYRNSFRPKWHCDISVIVTCYSKLVFRVYNHSMIKKDSLIGQCSLDLFSVLKQTNGKKEVNKD